MFSSSSAGIVIFYGLFQLAVWWFCHVQRDRMFYSMVLPINILLAIGVPLVNNNNIFWTIHKVYTRIRLLMTILILAMLFLHWYCPCVMT